MKAYI